MGGQEAQNPGTIISGLFANTVVSAANTSFKVGIAPLSDQEILRIAGLPGLAPSRAKDTFFDVSPFVLA